MAEKVVGGCAVLVCFLLGAFLALASVFALEGGKGDVYLYGLLALGVGLVVGGFALMWKWARPRPTRSPFVGEETHEGW